MLIERPWGITAYGHATAQVDPDHAVLRLAVNRIDNKPDKALQATSGAVAAVRNVLRKRHVPDAAVTSSRTSIHSVWDGYGADRRFRGHQCRVEFSIRITELDQVEGTLVELVGSGADEILGVDYDTSRTREVRAQARREAVAAAEAKARLYAEAAGVGLGPVVHVEDLNPDMPAAVAYRGAPESAAGGSDFAPGQITVAASVAVGYQIAH
ncbi:MAG TPA: SIMPL domain-containing protein [Acidimicrobiales bacterium]